ncbi:MAG: B12-binding domain-containing radical SAM protein [Desulfuromonadaceae bacterium]|nr:B12-binding domain-containing radical SAM protein [Desulfuromonadaceae bacterium]MDD5106549.1 B12-binding domain-containing radical SAM protein [Desulfuromonadaceae bacterium]
MKILLVYPRNPDTFWSFRYAMKFIDRKASFPPLGLLTVAAMLPEAWDKQLIDMNVSELSDDHLNWADYVFISAMSIQRESAKEVIVRCQQLGVKIVAGGPLFTSCFDEFPEVDHLVLGEAEHTLYPFLKDLKIGTATHLYIDERWADLKDTPIPLWKLVDVRDYAAMNIQYSRGCPFDCEFCDITQLFGRKPRSKSTEQILAELDSLNALGWRGAVFFVDDNFIGEKVLLKRMVLPAIHNWMDKNGRPFYFYTEASIELADDAQLMEQMVNAGFEEVFIGIETPSEEGLHESGKLQNKNRDMLASVKQIQQAGMQVHGGFIVGFDSDKVTIFERQINFIQNSGIVTAMVGVLIALNGTKLYKRLKMEGRLLGETTGNNTETGINFVPRMNQKLLVSGLQSILDSIYAPKNYYKRVIMLFKEYRPLNTGKFHIQPGYIGALFKSVIFLGVIGKERFHYWKLLLWTLARKPRLFPLAIIYSIHGFHFRKVAENMKVSG